MAFGVGAIAGGELLLVFAYFLMAIPTSLIARRLGHPMWIAYIAWCPFWAIFFQLFLFIHAQWLIWFFWLPGALYLWILALDWRRTAQ